MCILVCDMAIPECRTSGLLCQCTSALLAAASLLAAGYIICAVVNCNSQTLAMCTCSWRMYNIDVDPADARGGLPL